MEKHKIQEKVDAVIVTAENMYKEEDLSGSSLENPHLRMACAVRATYIECLKSFDRQNIFEALKVAIVEESRPLSLYGTG